MNRLLSTTTCCLRRSTLHFLGTMSYSTERAVAERAVRAAARLTSSVFEHLEAGDKVDKSDASPVTVGDFGAQAVIISLLGKAFPSIPVVGEEDADALRGEEATTLKNHVTSLARKAFAATAKEDPPLAHEDPKAHLVAQSLSGEFSEDELLDAIDRGAYEGGPKGATWVLDPIDGTKGFLRGGQYAICLGLLVDGQVQLGVIGCPNLPVHIGDESGPKGVLFSAVRGQGATQSPLFAPSSAPRTPIHFSSLAPTELSRARFCESVESGHGSHGTNARIAQLLELDTAHSVRMDSQAKYASIARGDGEIYLRIPVKDGNYAEKIWDHAASVVLVEESGGKVTDVRGLPLDFSLGRTLQNNKGVVGSPANVHDKVVKAVQQAISEESEERRKNILGY